jgi:hypothetical protein
VNNFHEDKVIRIIKQSRYSQFEEEVGGAPRNVRTVEHEEAVLNVFEEDGHPEYS